MNKMLTFLTDENLLVDKFVFGKLKAGLSRMNSLAHFPCQVLNQTGRLPLVAFRYLSGLASLGQGSGQRLRG